MLGGGASRADVQSQMIVRIAAIMMVMALLVLQTKMQYDRARAPLVFALLCALVVGFQLIPLPPELWMSLPGRNLFAEITATAGLEQPWRPLSLTPDLTLNTLLSIIPPTAAIIGLAALSSAQRTHLLPVLIGVTLVSAFLGILQISDGGKTFVLYRIWNHGFPVGLFANRNHQAAMIAVTLPMLIVWASLPSSNIKLGAIRPWIMLIVAMMLFLLLLVVGSRAGLILGILGIVGGAVITLGTPYKPITLRSPGARRIFALAAAISAPVIIAAAIFLSRAEALDRLDADAAEDLRFKMAQPVLQMIGDFMPVGAGFGSFDAVFRGYETIDILRRTYFNHAHNDLFELLSDAGIPGLFLLMIFLAWFVRRGLSIWRRSPRDSVSGLLGRLGALVVLLLLAASLVDYPLRTPLLAVVFAISCGWMCFARQPAPSERVEQNSRIAISEG